MAGAATIGGNVVSPSIKATTSLISSGSLNVTGNSTFDGTITSCGVSYLTGGVNVSNQATIAGPVAANIAMNSTSPQTGALTTQGGLGVALNSNFGGAINVYGITASTSTTTGSIVAVGGLGVAGAANVGGTLTTTGPLVVNNTTASTSPHNGALTCTGGLSVSGAANIGGNISAIDPLVIIGTTASTSPTTGLIVAAGGLGVAGATNIPGNTYIGGNFSVNGTITGNLSNLSPGSVSIPIGSGPFTIWSNTCHLLDLNVGIEWSDGSGQTIQYVDALVLSAETGISNISTLVTSGNTNLPIVSFVNSQIVIQAAGSTTKQQNVSYIVIWAV